MSQGINKTVEESINESVARNGQSERVAKKIIRWVEEIYQRGELPVEEADQFLEVILSAIEIEA